MAFGGGDLGEASMTASAVERVQAAKAILLDLDGCVVEDGRLKPGARGFLRAFGERISILSNNSTHTPGQIAALLARAGAWIPEGRIHLAGQVALEEAAQRCGARSVCLLSNATMGRAALALGLNVSLRAPPNAVILLRDTRFSYPRLARAVEGLRTGAPFIVSNPDLTHPKSGGVIPETGALLAAIMACIDPQTVTPVIVGKPATPLFERALAAAGVTPTEAIMLGDNPATDVAGAHGAGVEALLIGGSSDISLASIMRADLRLSAT